MSPAWYRRLLTGAVLLSAAAVAVSVLAGGQVRAWEVLCWMASVAIFALLAMRRPS